MDSLMFVINNVESALFAIMSTKIEMNFPLRHHLYYLLNFTTQNQRDPAFSFSHFYARNVLLKVCKNGTSSVTLSAPFYCIFRPNYIPPQCKTRYGHFSTMRRLALTYRMFCSLNYNGNFIN